MPVIGGRAHINGITFATNTHFVRGILKNGELTIQVQRLPKYAIIEKMDKIPFVRGISKMAKINTKLFLFVILFLAIPWDWLFRFNQNETNSLSWFVLLIYLLVLTSAVFLLKRLWQFHGAEHKAFNVYTSGCGILAESVKSADRVSNRCGTNLFVIMLPILFLLSFVLDNVPLVWYLVTISIGYEIFNWSSENQRLGFVYTIAAIIQRYIVTAEPNEEQLKLAITTIKKAIETEDLGSTNDLKGVTMS